MGARVIVLEDNLFFRAKVEGVLATAGHDVAYVASRQALDAALGEGADLVMVNLAARGPWTEWLGAVRAALGSEVPVVGYAPHGDLALHERGLAAGCNEVIPNGAFAKSAPRVVAEHVRAR